ncbi:agamous-like MADS-box protein AGL81 [Impatiens glandulifera]|uniref:agamous-like MADS-box protein AGL81 n=1 Tax=Impatiens glandulifera TaxID=253017 RepID=UPI001FB0E7BD|nr:agamous-like MADS-box protein AGL81 [Impatiens glandulifera]
MVKEGAKENTIKCDKKKQQMTMKMTNIKKKSMELSSLCDIDVCFICLEENGRIESWPDNLNQVKPILERYKKEVSKRKKKTSTTIAATDHVQTSKSGSSKARIGPLLDGLSQNLTNSLKHAPEVSNFCSTHPKKVQDADNQQEGNRGTYPITSHKNKDTLAKEGKDDNSEFVSKSINVNSGKAPGMHSSTITFDNSVKMNINGDKSKNEIHTDCPNKQTFSNEFVADSFGNQNQSDKTGKSQRKKRKQNKTEATNKKKEIT